MVCIYCGKPTQVTNSRLQKRDNQVWRRRRCIACKSIFTTHEACDLASSLVVKCNARQLVPFSRDKLFLSIYESCKHRPSVLQDTTALSRTVISNVVRAANDGQVSPSTIKDEAHKVLARFDTTAATVYAAYHS
jgi:transcriptional repressor NrdR